MTQTVKPVSSFTHDHDMRRYWVFRNGRPVKRAWNELTRTEKEQQREAEARAAYVATFDIY